MYSDLLLEQAVSDYLFHEPKESVEAFKSYVESIEKNPDNITEEIESYIFSRLDIYLEDFSLILEKIETPTDFAKHQNQAKKKIRDLEASGDLEPSKKDNENLGDLRKLKSLSPKEDNKKKNKPRKVLTSQQVAQQQESKRKNAATKERKSIIKAYDKKVGRPTLRGKIADAAKKIWKKTKIRKKISKAVTSGVKTAETKISRARDTYKKAAAKYEKLKASVKPENASAQSSRWKQIQQQKDAMLQARGKYRNLRMNKRYLFARRLSSGI